MSPKGGSKLDQAKEDLINDRIIFLKAFLRASPLYSVKSSTAPDCLINQPYGYWEKHTYRVPNKCVFKPNSLNKRKLKTLMSIGDSLMFRVSESVKKAGKICGKMVTACYLSYKWTYLVNRYHSQREEQRLSDKKDFDEVIFIKEITQNILQRASNENIFLINFGAHLLRSLPFQRLMRLFDKFFFEINEVKSKLGDRFPTLIWKTTTPNSGEHRNAVTNQVNVLQYTN